MVLAKTKCEGISDWRLLFKAHANRTRCFQEWVTSVRGREDQTRYNYCIYADQEVVDAVLNGDPPGTVTLEPTSFVKILDMSWDESRDSRAYGENLPSIEVRIGRETVSHELMKD